MNETNNEKKLEDYPLPVTIEGTKIILKQLEKCICKIENQNCKGTGFFCHIPYENRKLNVMITNNHIINDKILKNNEIINVTLNDDKEFKYINIKNKLIYTNTKYDTTIIEINPQEDKITDYLEIDDIIFEDINLYNKSIYILQYPNSIDEQKASVSYGLIKKITNNYDIIHYCSTDFGSSGSPILKLSNRKIIGIHKDNVDRFNYNRGTFLKYPIIEYLNMIKEKNNNEIKLTIEIKKEDVNNNIYFLDNTDVVYNENGNIKEYHHNNLKELNDSNIEVFINNQKYKYQKYFKPQNEGIYEIKLIFNNSIKDCSYMFNNCNNIINIDLSSFDTKNVLNMNSMFCDCNNLKNIIFNSKDISNMNDIINYCNNSQNKKLPSFNTKNVLNMSHMFCYCNNITSLDLSSFDTKNVKNMNAMFFNCNNLKKINLSSFDTKNVTDISAIFCGCNNLENIDLSSFNTKNVKNMSAMFCDCNNLKEIDLSSFDTKNVENMSKMFSNCNNLKKINLSFQTQNVRDMSGMFSNCNNLKNLDITTFDTQKVINMSYMFCNCNNLKAIDLSSFETKNVADLNAIFYKCNNLDTIIINPYIKNIKLKNSFKSLDINIIDNFNII